MSQVSQPMEAVFTVLVSEKGGGERREFFDRAEITVGRVHGNDLVLPKGNVSKRHARLVFRDSRFIVTDLNSTNGTYVNRRRITQATIVREGDRIYVGDFILRLDAAGGLGVSATAPEVTPSTQADERLGSAKPPPPPPRGPALSTGRVPVRESGSGAFPAVPRPPRIPTTVLGGQTLAPSAPLPDVIPLEQVSSRSGGRRSEDSIDAETTAYRSAVAALVARVESLAAPLGAEVDDDARSRVEAGLERGLEALRAEGAIGAAVVEARLLADARAELLELGPLGGVLSDELVTDIAISGTHPLSVARGPQRALVEPPLSSERSLQRVLARLCARSGQPIRPDESVVERLLPGGFTLTGITGPATPSGSLLVLRRPARIDVTLEDLVRAGTLSRSASVFLRHCAAGRLNMLVVGPREAGVSSVVCALATASPDGLVIAVQERDQLVSSSVTVTHLSVDNSKGNVERLLAVAAAVPDGRLAIENLSGPLAAGVLDAIGRGSNGVVAGLYSTSVRNGLARLSAEIGAVRPGTTVVATREWLAASFQLVLEVARLADERQRVLKISEVVGVKNGQVEMRDIFTFTVERMAAGGSVEGSFGTIGGVPGVVEELLARGVEVDSGLFARAPSS